MTAIRGPAPGFRRHPDHHIQIHKSASSWRVSDGKKTLAESDHALIVTETGYGEVIYFPAEDVRGEHLMPTESDTSCPFKGRARYFRLADDVAGADVAWTYPDTYNEVVDVRGLIAFYADRISIEESQPIDNHGESN